MPPTEHNKADNGAWQVAVSELEDELKDKDDECVCECNCEACANRYE